MSLILQALKKAEAERALGQVPSAHATLAETDPPTPSRSSQRAARWAGAALLAAGLGAAGWWASRATPTPPSSTPAASVERSQPQATAPLPSTPPNAAVATDAAPAPVTPGPSPAPGAVVATTQAPSPPRTTAGQAAQPAAAMQAPRTPPTSAPAAVPASAPTPATERPALRLEDLPAAVRRTLPPLALGGVIHAERRADRMVILDGEVRREGELVAPDLVVERIEPRGVTLRHQGQALRLGF